MSESSVPVPGTGEIGEGAQPAWAGGQAEPDPRRWLILVVIGIAQLMIVLDLTVMNLALPSAQHALGFNNVDRQWVVTAYSLSFGSLLLFCGRLADIIGRKVMFLTGLTGFAVASAIGGASVNFEMLVTARACQGVFAAMLAPAALSLLTTTFADPKERGKAFGIYGSITGAGAAVGLLLGGALTSYLSWRWCLYINLVFAGAAIVGGALWLRKQPKTPGAKLDIPGVLLVSSGMFSLVYGFSNAATHGWSTPSTWGWLAAGVVLLAAFGWWQTRASHPLLPPRVVLDRNRGGAYLAILIVGAGMFGIFLFLTYYMQVSLGYSPVVSGLAFLPMVACIAVAANVSNIVLLPRIGPKPIVIAAFLLLAGAQLWLTRIGVRGDYVGNILGPLMVTGVGMGFMFSTALNAGHVRGGASGRGCRLGFGEHRAAARRVDRHLSLQHDRGERDDELHRRAHRGGRSQPGRAEGRPGRWPGARLHDRVLVVRGDLPGRRGGLRDAAAPRAAAGSRCGRRASPRSNDRRGRCDRPY